LNGPRATGEAGWHQSSSEIEMSRRSRALSIQLIALVLVLVACGGGTGDRDWVLVTPAGGGYTVEMPFEPKAQTQTMDTLAGRIPMNIWIYEVSDGGYATMWSDYPRGTIVDPHQSLIGARDGAVANVKGTLLDDSSIGREGLPGRAFSASSAGATMRAEIFLRGDRIIQLIVVSKEGASGFDYERFFASFKLTG
jgi:hypothetical protein